MDSSESSPFDSFKSKKVLHSTVKPLFPDEVARAPDRSTWSSKTPEKPVNPPHRDRNRRAALSVKQVREAAEKLRKSNRVPSDLPDPLISGFPLESPVTKSKKVNTTELPEKHEILDKFFNSLDSSIRLLRMKGSMSTFTNIVPKIECLTDRRFSYGHLAQLKFILPEALEIVKILARDERTSCMKPDLHVSLNVNAIENDEKLKSDSGSLQLRKVFRARLLSFYKAHPEGDDVPEEKLPEPFNQSKQGPCTNAIKDPNWSLIHETSIDALPEGQPAAASHLSRSFQRHFSKQASSHGAVKVNKELSRVHLRTAVLPASEPPVDQTLGACVSTAPSPIKLSSKIITRKKCLASGPSVASSSSHLRATPIKNLDPKKNEDFSSIGTAGFQGTPAKLVSTPLKLMSDTPALQPPKRSFMSPDDDSVKSPNKLVRRPSSSKSLKFDTPVKNEICSSRRLSVNHDLFDILPENLLESIKEKERKALEELDPAISQAKWRKQMIASLPKLFDMLLSFFHSIKRSVITKEELVHRIISSHLEIVDQREVDEQLRLLQELAPEWIYEKMASSGDLLFCINKIPSPESIRTRLVDAQ